MWCAQAPDQGAQPGRPQHSAGQSTDAGRLSAGVATTEGARQITSYDAAPAHVQAAGLGERPGSHKCK